MEIKQMRVFLVAAESLNFTKAAEKLYLTQQMVSKTIADLETELGASLFIRANRRVELSAFGKEAYITIRNLVDEFDRSTEKLMQKAKADHSRLRIVCYRGLRNKWLDSQFYESLRAEYGKDHIDIIISKGLHLSALLEYKNIDLFFTIADGATIEYMKQQGHEIYIIQKTPMRVVVAADHPWHSLKQVSLEDLRKDTLVRVNQIVGEPSGTVHKSFHAMARDCKVFDNLESALMEVEMGRGYALFPEADEVIRSFNVISIGLSVQDEPLYILSGISKDASPQIKLKLAQMLQNPGEKIIHKKESLK